MSLNYSYQASAGQNGANTTAGNSGQLMAVNNNSTINSTPESASYTYDLQGRLVTSNQTTNSTSAQRRFSYDRWGNRTAVWDATSGGTQIQSTTLQLSGGVPTNRLSSVTTIGVTNNYTYDAAGNVTNDGSHSYLYDGENRLASVDSGAASYGYDAQNRRIKKSVAGTTTHYVWEGTQVIAEYNAATGGLIIEYTYAGSRMLTAGTSYMLSDRLSARLMLDTSFNVVGRQGHLPFGEEIAASGTTDKHKFTSYERDSESGTDYAVNRQYGQNVGRFMRVDPMAGSINNPQSLNRFTYVQNDPINTTDPKGLFALLFCHGNIGSNYEFNEDGSPNFTIGPIAGETCEVIPIDFSPINSGDEGEPQTRCQDELNELEQINSTQKFEFDLIARMAGNINPVGIEAAINDFNMLLDEFNTRFGDLSGGQASEYMDRFGAIGNRVGQLFANADKKTKREVRDRAHVGLELALEAAQLAKKLEEDTSCKTLFAILPQDRARFEKAIKEAKMNSKSYGGYYSGVLLGTFRP